MIESNFFSKSNLSLKELFSNKKEYTAIAGAGVSMDAPSCLLSAKQIVKYLVEYCVAKEEVNKLLSLPGLRYELVIGGIKEFYDKNLNFMNFFDFFEIPNINHHFIAGLLISGLGDVITTNFDYLIELAVMEHLGEKDYPRIMPVITKPDFNLFIKKEQIKKLKEEKKIPICKIHGSKKNIVTGENTTQTLVTTMADLGRDREGAGIFSVEPYKLPLLNNLTEGRTIIVMGYSGSDDFDIGPTLRDLPNVNEIIWINHVMNDLPNEIEILEINNKVRKAEISEGLPQIDRVLGLVGKELKEKGSNIKIYRIDVNTTKFVDKILWNILIPQIEKPQLGGPDKSREELEHIIKGLIGEQIESNILRWQMAYYLYSNLFKDDDALLCARAAIEVSEKENNLPMKAISMHQAGSALVRKYQFEEALKYFEDALKIAEKDFFDELYLAIGNTLKELGKQKETIKYFRKGGKIAKENDDLKSLTKFAIATGSLYSSLGQYGLALSSFNEALGYLDKLGDLNLKADVLTNIAEIKVYNLKYDEAHKLHEEILKLQEILGDPTNIAFSYNNLAVNMLCFANFKQYNESNKIYYDNAFNYCQKALEIAESIPNVKAAVYDTLAGIYFYLEDYEKSLNYYEKALKIYQEIKDIKNLADTYKEIAEFYRKKREFDKALDNHKKSLQIGENIKNIFFKSKLYNSYAVTLSWSEKHAESREYAIKSLNISEELSRADMDVELTQNYNLPKVNVIVQKMNIAATYFNEAKWEDALKWYNQILPLKENVLMDLDILVSYSNIGNIYKNLKDFNKANEYQVLALKFAEKTNNLNYEIAIRKDIAWNYMELKDYEKAYELYKQCIDIGENSIKGLNKDSKTYKEDLNEGKISLASIYNQIAIMYDRQELHEKAIEYYKISAEKFEEVNALPNLAVVLENVAYTYSVLKDYENSKSYYLKAVDFYAKIGDSRNEMMINNKIGNIYSYLIQENKDLFNEGISYYKKAVEIADRINSISDKSIYLYNLGNIYRRNGFLKEAIEYYTEANNEAETVGDYLTCGDSNYYIGVCYGQLNEDFKDIEFLKKSLEYYYKVKNEDVTQSILVTLIDIGDLYSKNNLPDESLKYFRQVLDIAQQNNNILEICKTFNRIGNSYSKNKMHEEAFKWYQKALDNAIEHNYYDSIITSYRNIANNFENSNQYEKAIEYYKKSLEMRNKDNDKEGIELDLTDIGYLLRELKRYEESIEVFRQQVEISEKIPNSKKLRNGYRWIGRILIDQNKREEAIKYYLKAVNYDHQIGNYEDESDDLADVAYTYYELNNIPESCNYYEKYIETREKYGYKDYKKYIKRLQEYAMQYYKLSEWQKSLRVFEIKYQVILKHGTIEEKTDVLKDIGVLQRNVQEYDKSIQTHKDALQHARELNNIELIYDILWELGITYMECNDWGSALKTNSEIFQISDTNKWDGGKFLSAERLGICYYNLKDIEKSVDYLDLSIVLGDSIFKNTSKSYYYIGKIEEDNEYYEEAKYGDFFVIKLDQACAINA